MEGWKNLIYEWLLIFKNNLWFNKDIRRLIGSMVKVDLRKGVAEYGKLFFLKTNNWMWSAKHDRSQLLSEHH